MPVLGLETSSFAAMWCFGGYGRYLTMTASSVEVCHLFLFQATLLTSGFILSLILGHLITFSTLFHILTSIPTSRVCTITAHSYPDIHVLFLLSGPLATSGTPFESYFSSIPVLICKFCPSMLPSQVLEDIEDFHSMTGVYIKIHAKIMF
jgi:hypothetical protein